MLNDYLPMGLPALWLSIAPLQVMGCSPAMPGEEEKRRSRHIVPARNMQTRHTETLKSTVKRQTTYSKCMDSREEVVLDLRMETTAILSE